MKITTTVKLKRSTKGRKSAPKEPEVGRLPRVTKLMALAIKFDQMIRDGVVADQAELARLGHVSRARITQIMNLLNLAPDIQETLLFLPRVAAGQAQVEERRLRPVSALLGWKEQRVMNSMLSSYYAIFPLSEDDELKSTP